jgi:ribonuclease BN (tRNA processing enzyme)
MTLKRFLIIASICAAQIAPAAATCPGKFAVEVLGSGGPLADDARASSSYLVWIEGNARLLLDAGGGAFVRFGEAGADMTTLDAILISHLHADHVSDLAALMKSASFDRKDEPLLIAGPSGAAAFPGISEFLAAHFDPVSGAYRYLSRILTGEDGSFRISPFEVDATREGAMVILENAEIKIEAVPVNHGDVPALAVIVSTTEGAVIFAGDQSLLSETFDRVMAGRKPDVLIAHHAISGARGQPRGLHRDPGSIGEMAASVGAKRLILSHNMKRALDDWRAGRKAIRKSY